MKKFLSVLLILVLACSFSLVTAVPVSAAEGESVFTVTGGTYTTVPTDPDPEPQTGDIEANLTGTWGASAVIGDFTATGEGGLYLNPPYDEWGTTATISVSGTMSADGITFSGTALRTLGDPITDDTVTDIAGTLTIQLDGTFVATLTGMASTDLGPLACTLGISGSMARVTNVSTGESFFTIQAAIDDAETLDGHTISVAAGEYAGAIVKENLNIIGEAGGASIITSGVPYKVGKTLYTGFRLDDGADGAEVRNFTMNGDYAEYFWFAVFARSADDVIVDLLTLDNMVQGITNWGGSGWEITNNVITETYPTYGGGIAIYLGADPTDFPNCDNNLVQGNIISTSAEQDVGFTGAAICLFFDEREGYGYPKGGYTPPIDESVTGNEIKDNSITATGLGKQVGIEIGVGGLGGDTIKVAACLGVIHDNTVTNNTIDNAEWGLNLYVTTNLTVSGNTIKNCSDCGIYMKDDHANCLINYNDIHGNTNYGLNNTDGATYERTVDATNNWWGDVAGPSHNKNPYDGSTNGDTVSDDVDYLPWLIHTELAEGWNVYSTPIALDDSSSTIVDALNVWGVYDWGEGDMALYFDPSIGESGGWEEATSLTPLQAVYIKLGAAATIDVVFSTDYSEIPSQTMYAGWNLIGLAELYDKDAEDALASAYYVAGANNIGYSQVVSPAVGQTAWSAVRGPAIDTSTGETMSPGESYWLFMVNEGTLAGFTSTPITLLP